MANKTTVEFFDANGDKQTITLPEYAMDSTLDRLVDAMKGIAGLNADTKKALEDLGRSTKKANDNRTQEQKDADKLMNDQLDALKSVNKSVQDGNKSKKEDMSFFSSVLSDTGSILKSVFLTAASYAGSALYNLGTLGYNTGQALIDLNEKGILLGKNLEGISPAGQIAQFTQLGMSATNAANMLGNYSQLVATQGTTSMRKAAVELGNITLNGAQFGMTMQELTGVMMEELELRQMMGMINMRDDTLAAANAKRLMSEQLRFAQVLGKSINDLQKASDDTIQNPLFQASMAALDMANQSADNFTTELRKAQSEMAGAGFDQKLITQMGNEMVDIVAFISEGGKDIFTAFSATGTDAGQEVTGTLNEINNLLRDGKPEEAAKRLAGLPDAMREAMVGMGDEELLKFKDIVASLNSEMGMSLLASVNSVRLFDKRMKEYDPTKRSRLEDRFSQLAQGAAAFDSAKNSIVGSLDTIRMGFADALGPSMQRVAELLTTFADAFILAGPKFSESFKGIADNLGKLLGDDIDDMSKFIEEKILPRFQLFVDGVNRFLTAMFDPANNSSIEGFFDGLVGIAKTVTWFSGILFDVGKFVVGFFSASMFSGMEDGIFKGILQIVEFLGKAFLAAGLVSVVKNGIGSMLGMGGGAGATAAGGGVGKAMSGAGKGIATLGTGIGKGAGGMLKGLAGGLAAFANPAILAGAGILAGSIILIAGGISAGGYLISLSMPAIAEGLREFDDIDGVNLIAIGGGLIALGAGLVAFGAGSVVGAVGNMAGGILDGINAFFGGDSPIEKVKKFGEVSINYENVKNNAMAMAAFGGAMAAFGAGNTVGSLGNIAGNLMDGIASFFGGETPLEKVKNFGDTKLNVEQIEKNANAFKIFAEALSVAGGANFSQLDDIGDVMDDINDELEHFSNARKINPEILAQNSNALTVYASALSKLSEVDADKLALLADSVESLMESAQKSLGPGISEIVGQSIASTGQAILDFGVNLFSGTAEGPSTESMKVAEDGTDGAGGTGSKYAIHASIDDKQIKQLVDLLSKIEKKTVA